MCGIAGIFLLDSANKDKLKSIKKMTGALTHRGPDDEGFYFNDKIGLGHRRLNIIDLSTYGSIYVTRPVLFHYTASRPALESCANDLFSVIGSGAVKIEIHQTYPLENTAQAHRDLEARKTTGSTVLLP